MKPTELARARRRLEAFAADVFGSLARADQRRRAEAYLRGLLLDGKRKSVEPMAARLTAGGEADVADLEQALQQFVNQSPWDPSPARRRLAEKVVEAIRPEAFVVDDTAFPKFGRASVGVAPQYCGALGKVANCQVGVSVHAATDEASCPLDWRLFLPEDWDDDERRRRARVPDGEGHRPKWKLALEAIDELAAWGLAPPVVLADAGYGDVTGFRTGLEERNLAYVVQAKGTTSAYAPDASPEAAAYSGRGRPPVPRYRRRPSSLRGLAIAAGPEATTEVAWREGTRGPLTGRFLALRCRPANVGLRRAGAGELPVRWLVVEWPPDEAEPTKYWLSNLVADADLIRLVRLAKLRWRVEEDYRELKDALGLDHFEGRSWQGWHHHVTLVSAAHAFVTLERLDPKALAPA